jgi:hypothetical protein
MALIQKNALVPAVRPYARVGLAGTRSAEEWCVAMSFMHDFIE